MGIALFCIYLFLFAWVVTRVKFFTDSGVSKEWLVIIYLINVLAGIVYGWIGMYQSSVNNEMTDTWVFHYAGLRHAAMLFNDPHAYAQDIVVNSYGDGGLFTSSNSYWNNLKGNAFIKLLSVFDCFSFGNYFINVIFYCFIVLFGTVALYRVMSSHFKTHRFYLVAGCFFIPSFLYWNNGIHKDGLCFLGISMIIYCFYFYVNRNVFSAKVIAGLVTGGLLLFVFKNHLLAILLPALAAWYWAERQPRQKLKIFMVVYILVIIGFFGSRYISPVLDFPAVLAEKQQAFNALPGGRSSLKVQQLEPTVASFIKLLPQAISLSSFRPYYSDIYSWLIVLAVAELLFLWAMLLLAIFYYAVTVQLRTTPFGFFISIYSISVLLAIGYTVNNLGATVRYRSIIIPLVAPFLLAALYRYKLNKYKK
ncbi:MAG: hypothetical protein QM640_11500 [Niabella sp.]